MLHHFTKSTSFRHFPSLTNQFRFLTTHRFTFKVNFTHIVKFETFDRDQKHIIRKSGIGHLVTTHRENVAKDGKKSVDLMREYLDELPLDLYYELLKVYLIDFQLFGYDIPPPENRSFIRKLQIDDEDGKV